MPAVIVVAAATTPPLVTIAGIASMIGNTTLRVTAADTAARGQGQADIELWSTPTAPTLSRKLKHRPAPLAAPYMTRAATCGHA